MKIVTFRLVRRGKKSALIVNERGEEEYDYDFILSNKVHIEHLRGG